MYSLPAVYEAVTGETITATQHNTPLTDLQTDANTARPIVAGGTGASTKSGAATALELVSYGASQSLTDTQKTQARSNIDVQPTASPTFTGTVTADIIDASGNISGVDVTASGDLAVSGDAEVTGDLTVAGIAASGNVSAVDVTASGDLSVTGDTEITGSLTVGGGSPGFLVAIVEDQKTSGTSGGTFNNGADRTRDLNTLTEAIAGIVTLSSNQFTITPTGTQNFFIRWSAPADTVDSHQSMLYNVTSSAISKRGSTERSPESVGNVTRSEGSVVVEVSAATKFEIRHRCQNTSSTSSGLGFAGSFGTEIYTRVEIWRM